MSSFLFLIRNCFGIKREKQVHLEDAPILNNAGLTQAGCIFCGVEPENGFDVILQTSDLVVFRDRSPAAAEHLLVTPRKHIGSVRDLTRDDIPLLQEMKTAGHRALDCTGVNFPPGSRRMGFHIPPFNSVMHLHLHVHGLPYRSLLRKLEYPFAPGPGALWFITIDQAIEKLEDGQRIKVSLW